MKRFIWLLLIPVVFGQDSKPFHPTRDRYYDVHHIRIDLTVDIGEHKAFGTVEQTLSPLSNSFTEFILDAEDMEISSVILNKSKSLSFEQTSDQLWTYLDRAYGFEDTLNIIIQYSAQPKRGLFFIKPDSAYPDKHYQAWTQGEDTDNHHWVPLYDYPNDKATFECILTVDTPLVAISNGELVAIKDKGATRTYHWQENYPMVSYLISFAVGEYQKVEDDFNGLPVRYWVYPEHTKKDALRSFGRTPEMIAFFNQITMYDYPYEKYDQVIIEDFMWGGMENITLTHQTDRTMHTDHARPDHTSDGLVAHELAHQWYGDLITTRNWANAWLNEGFATFLTYLWVEYDKGEDEAEYLRLDHIEDLKAAEESDRRPMVQYYYDDSMELFNANIYDKGSVVLNMLRQILGKETFLRTIQYYTRTYSYRTVETEDFKKAIEDVTGQNLFWFFKQWIYRGGLPEFEVISKYSRRSQELTLIVHQVQDLSTTSLFKVPVTVMVDNGEILRKTIWVEEQETVATIPCSRKPQMVIFDEGQIIPKFLKFEKTDQELIYQAQNAPHILDRIWAINELSEGKASRKVIKALKETALSDSFWGARLKAIEAIGKLKPKNEATWLISATVGQDNRVQRACIRALENYKNEEVKDYLVNVIQTSNKDYAIADAIKTLTKVDSTAMGDFFDWALDLDSHKDVIRKAAISYLGSLKSERGYRRLLDLAKYGHSTYESRPIVFKTLGNYAETYPEVVEVFMDYLHDPDFDVRKECIEQLADHGNMDCIHLLQDLLDEDPVNEHRILNAIKEIEDRKAQKEPSEKSLLQELKELKRKLAEIKSIVYD